MQPQRVQMETVFFYVFHFLGVRSKLRLALKRIFVAANAKKVTTRRIFQTQSKIPFYGIYPLLLNYLLC